MGAGLPANTGGAGAIHRAGFFAGKPAPTEITVPCATAQPGKAV
ncbi:diguanylate cyclase [Pseudomonas mosselii]|nr:diguanylate cyclase [Pseudomonas mosselii]